MRRLAALGAACAMWGADPGLLERIRDQMEENLAKVPNYTCLETIERSVRTGAKRDFTLVDRLRFEVAMVEGREMYSWPGARTFEERTPADVVRGGTTTTGDYALHAKTIFASHAPEFDAGREETWGGRRTVRYGFRVARKESSYRVKVGDKSAIVPYGGSFRADPQTLDLLRLEVDVSEIPEELGIQRATTEIEYGKVRVGSSDFLLPQRVEFLLRESTGHERRNRTEFSRCRQYVGESEISFEEPGEPHETGGAAQPWVDLPDGLVIETRLLDSIDTQKSAIGDPLAAEVTFAAKRGGRVVVPKGARLSGRVRRLERGAARAPYYVVELEFHEIEWEGGRARWRAELDKAGPLTGAARNALLTGDRQAPGCALLYIAGGRVRLPQGFRMLWVTGTK